MKVLILGGGGREHAIAWRLTQEPGVEVYAAPGNPGIANCGICVPVPDPAPHTLAKLAEDIGVDLTIAGPEAPLVAGAADAFAARDLAFFGPSRAAAMLEASKQFAKNVMIEAGIPTAAYHAASSIDEARNSLSKFSYPLVLKADGLAAGKGVIIARDHSEALAALDTLGASLGPRILIEEFLEGEEASFIVLSDGTTAIPLEASQDHKTIFDGDCGPNTGGMGAYCDGRILTAAEGASIMDTVIQPALDYMRARSTPFVGFLYAGLMMTAAGPKVLEFNVRLGDPETQCLLHRLTGGFLSALTAAAAGDLGGSRLQWSSDPSICVVLAASGYPDQPRTGDSITGIEAAEATGVTVFQAGTRRTKEGVLQTAGGRVLGVTASGSDLATAIANAYRAAGHIHFDGMQLRKDIGKKGLKRW